MQSAAPDEIYLILSSPTLHLLTDRNFSTKSLLDCIETFFWCMQLFTVMHISTNPDAIRAVP